MLDRTPGCTTERIHYQPGSGQASTLPPRFPRQVTYDVLRCFFLGGTWAEATRHCEGSIKNSRNKRRAGWPQRCSLPLSIYSVCRTYKRQPTSLMAYWTRAGIPRSMASRVGHEIECPYGYHLILYFYFQRGSPITDSGESCRSTCLCIFDLAWLGLVK